MGYTGSQPLGLSTPRAFQWVHSSSTALRLFLTVGLCGGFTTFSTFTNDLFLLARGAQWGTALSYTLVSLIGGVALLIVGYKLTT